MAITTLGQQFENIRRTQGEAAALAFLEGQNNAGPVDPLAFHAGRGFLTEAATLAAGPTPPLQQVFNMATRVNQRVAALDARLTARVAAIEQGTLAGFQAVARLFGR